MYIYIYILFFKYSYTMLLEIAVGMSFRNDVMVVFGSGKEDYNVER